MKVKKTLLLLVLVTCTTAIANANQEQVDPDFLDFLVEMEEVTGDGFETWLETENQDENENNLKSEKDE